MHRAVAQGLHVIPRCSSSHLTQIKPTASSKDRWGTPGCPAPYLGVHAEEVVRSSTAQRGALKRLAVVKVVIVFQASNLKKKKKRLFGLVFFLKSVFLWLPPHFVLAGSEQPCPAPQISHSQQSSQGWGGCRMLARAPVPPL